MEFRKKIEISEYPFKINHQTNLMIFGSCFAENIGNMLDYYKFKVNINPFGILYNPSSISQSLQSLLDNKSFDETDVFKNQGVYRSFAFHSDFCDIDKSTFLDRLNVAREQASADLLKSDVLMITLGTSYVYTLKASKQVVSNCHKIKASEFERYRLSVSEIVEDWSDLIDALLRRNPELKILFTVSPIRHWKDGAHNNQISKSILLLAIDELQQRFSSVFYFPSYEIVLDELRDYRFYREDMIHPNEFAVKYIWSVFGEVLFNDETQKINKQLDGLLKAVSHKAFNIDTIEHQHFLKQTLLKLGDFCNKYPYFECSKELESLEKNIRR